MFAKEKTNPNYMIPKMIIVTLKGCNSRSLEGILFGDNIIKENKKLYEQDNQENSIYIYMHPLLQVSQKRINRKSNEHNRNTSK